MTGFGSGSAETETGSVRAEVRSVNSRHLNVSLRLPERAAGWESELRTLVGKSVRRGQVDVRLSAGTAKGDEVGWELDEARVQAYLEAFRILREEYNLPGQLDLGLLLRGGELLRSVRADELGWLELEHLESALREALDGLVDMREREGARLAEDLAERIEAIRESLADVERLAPERLRRERDRLRKAVAELAGGLDLEEDRLAREIAVLADKWDIGEEVVRARSHLDALEEYLRAPSEEPVGKRLSFLVQELHREINTMGAKANDARITRLVVEMKNEVERLREQVENVE